MQWTDPILGSAVAGMSVVVVLALWAAAILVAIWVARDASQRGVPAPWAWSLAALFHWVGVLVVYLVVRNELAQVPSTESRPALR